MKSFSHLYPIILIIVASFWTIGLAFFILDNLNEIRNVGSSEAKSRVAAPNLPFYPFPICH